MQIDVVTIFPELVDSWTSVSMLGRVIGSGLCSVRTLDPRRYSTDAHRSVDDAPYGGGAGMVMSVEPIDRVLREDSCISPVFLLSPSGRRFDQNYARELAAGPGFTLICGRYEGVDQRVADHLCDGEISVGDVVLNGGEAAAIVVLEAVTRLLPGAMGNAASTEDESFADDLLEYPQYTRPANYLGHAVPEVLRSGDHAAVAAWRRAQALDRTRRRRPDLLERRGPLSRAEQSLLVSFGLGDEPPTPSE